MWFYHAPSKRVEKPQQFVPPASQVPGLAALDPLDEEAWKRELGVRPNKYPKESDSKYIRLAKQGGRKNLLIFDSERVAPTQPKPYPRVDWFDHHTTDPEQDEKILSQSSWQPPEYMVYDYEPSDTPDNVPRGKKRTPFYTDNKSVWTREQDTTNEKKVLRRRRKANKLPEIPVRPQKTNSVTFSKLIGGGYGNDWHCKQAGRGQLKTKFTELSDTKSYLNMTEYQESICKKAIPPKKLKPIVLNHSQRLQKAERQGNGELFKLKKFNKVESKLSTGSKALAST